MKLAELEQYGRTKLAEEKDRLESNAEEKRQAVIVWLAKEMALDEDELQEVLSIHDVKVKSWDGREIVCDAEQIDIQLSIPEHKSIFFLVEKGQRGVPFSYTRQFQAEGFYSRQFRVEGASGFIQDLGAALVQAAEEWAKDQIGKEEK